MCLILTGAITVNDNTMVKEYHGKKEQLCDAEDKPPPEIKEMNPAKQVRYELQEDDSDSTLHGVRIVLKDLDF